MLHPSMRGAFRVYGADRGVDPLPMAVIEIEGDRYRVAFLGRLRHADQHHMITAGLEFGLTAGLDFNIGHGAHLHDAVFVDVGMQFDGSGCRAFRLDELTVGLADVLNTHESSCGSGRV